MHAGNGSLVKEKLNWMLYCDGQDLLLHCPL